MLQKLQEWMTFLGWENGGIPGSVKRDAKGEIIAQHGDNIWTRDMEAGCTNAVYPPLRMPRSASELKGSS
jgi:hypothetical protein